MTQIGTKAPDFALKDQNGKTTRLSGSEGKRVLLSFRPVSHVTPMNQSAAGKRIATCKW